MLGMQQEASDNTITIAPHEPWNPMQLKLVEEVHSNAQCTLHDCFVRDAKTFPHLSELQVYGPVVIINKEECINHVSERVIVGFKDITRE